MSEPSAWGFPTKTQKEDPRIRCQRANVESSPPRTSYTPNNRANHKQNAESQPRTVNHAPNSHANHQQNKESAPVDNKVPGWKSNITKGVGKSLLTGWGEQVYPSKSLAQEFVQNRAVSRKGPVKYVGDGTTDAADKF
eukprot:PhF_6_TR16752/c0_g1_i1/m.25357